MLKKKLQLFFRRLKKHAVVRIKLAQRNVRNSTIILVLLCVIIAIFLSILVLFINRGIRWCHHILFLINSNEYLSAASFIPSSRILIIPCIGGLCLGLIKRLIKKWRPNDIVDPVEANALLGGKLNLIDSIRLTTTTIISNISGASVGMEAGYTQICAGIFSNIGKWFHLRREDLRIFVGAGAAAAIATVYNAPLAGTFYAFEMMLGSYTVSALAPVSAAAFSGALFTRLVKSSNPIFMLTTDLLIEPWQYLVFIIMGVFAGYFSIFTMKIVTWTEQGFKKVSTPDWLKPAIGGFALGLMALTAPQVLGSGQRAIQYNLDISWPIYTLLLMFVVKLVASSVSLGSGFLGGLFSSSIFIGSLYGSIIGYAVGQFTSITEGQMLTFVLVGMGSFGAGVIGTPMTMVMLVLELTGDYKAALGVMSGAITSFLLVRTNFGYSFSTWKFHLKGKMIKDARDIGWLNEIKVKPIVRNDMKTININETLANLRKMIEHRAKILVIAVDDNGLYEGLVDVVMAKSPDLDNSLSESISSLGLVSLEKVVLTNNSSVSRAIKLFEEGKTEILPVIANLKDYSVVGYVSEIDVFRYYARALEKKRDN
ncbi:MAG: chloride channel protein [Alphaproteobacteria bacterium]